MSPIPKAYIRCGERADKKWYRIHWERGADTTPQVAFESVNFDANKGAVDSGHRPYDESVMP